MRRASEWAFPLERFATLLVALTYVDDGLNELLNFDGQQDLLQRAESALACRRAMGAIRDSCAVGVSATPSANRGDEVPRLRPARGGTRGRASEAVFDVNSAGVRRVSSSNV